MDGETMLINVLVHLEAVQAESETVGFSWWAESPDLPGYSAAADHLPELLKLTEEGLPEFLGAREVEIAWHLVAGDSSTVGDSAPDSPGDAGAARPVSTSVEAKVAVPVTA